MDSRPRLAISHRQTTDTEEVPSGLHNEERLARLFQLSAGEIASLRGGLCAPAIGENFVEWRESRMPQSTYGSMGFGAWKRKVLNLNKGNSFSSLPVPEDDAWRVEGKSALGRVRRAIQSRQTDNFIFQHQSYVRLSGVNLVHGVYLQINFWAHPVKGANHA